MPSGSCHSSNTVASLLKSHKAEINQNLLVKPFSLLFRLEMLSSESMHKAEKRENIYSKAKHAKQQLKVLKKDHKST